MMDNTQAKCPQECESSGVQPTSFAVNTVEISSSGRTAGDPSVTYLICGGPRTGSTLLAGGLKATGVAGEPGEYFDLRTSLAVKMNDRFSARSDAEYLEKVIDSTMTANGVFGLKLHWAQQEALRQSMIKNLGADVQNMENRSLHALIKRKFGEPKYIWLQRRNKVAQAISHYRASRTGIWTSSQPSPTGSFVPDESLIFDFETIRTFVNVGYETDRQWETYFRQLKLRPLVLIYENFAQTYAATIAGVLGFLGIPFDPDNIVAPTERRQSDQRSAEWERQYRMQEMKRASSRVTIAPLYRDGPERPKIADIHKLRHARASPNRPFPWSLIRSAERLTRILRRLRRSVDGWTIINTPIVAFRW
jgi:LPS sulfotransferase NodH